MKENKKSPIYMPEFVQGEQVLKDFETLNSEAKKHLAGFTGGDYEADFTGKEAPQFKNARSFTLTIANAVATTESLVIMPGIKYNMETPENGLIREAAVAAEFASEDGTASTFSCAGAPRDVDTFLQWVRSVPIKLIGAKVKSTVATQLDQRMYVTKQSPFVKTDKTESINLAEYVNEYAQNDKIATVRFNEQLDNQTRLTLDVVGNSTLTLTLFFGEKQNLAAMFSEQA